MNPKPYDQIPFGEEYEKKAITITNDTKHSITIGQLPSSWDSVNFVIDDYRSKSKHKLVKWLATLEPTDKIELTFNPLDKIEP